MCVGIDDDDEDDEYGYGTLCVILWRGCNCSGWIWNCEKSSLKCFFLAHLFIWIALAALIFHFETNALRVGLRTMDNDHRAHIRNDTYSLDLEVNSHNFSMASNELWNLYQTTEIVKQCEWQKFQLEALVSGVCVLVMQEYGVTYLISFY